MAGRIYIGTAGWSIPRAAAQHCPGSGTHLQRYAQVFDCAEINSSFYRSHGPATYARWAGSTDADFKFSVKVPRTITHEQKLRRARVPLVRFLGETSGLGPQRGPLLVQLPPSLSFDARVAATFFRLVRSCHDGSVVCEPRHPSWFAAAATNALRRYRIARVVADPAAVPEAMKQLRNLFRYACHAMIDRQGVRRPRLQRPRSRPRAWRKPPTRGWHHPVRDARSRTPKGLLTFWTRARRLLWSWWPWAVVTIWAIGDARWGWAIGAGAMGLVSYLIAPHRRRRLDMDSTTSSAVDSPEFVHTVAGATGSPFLDGNTLSC